LRRGSLLWHLLRLWGVLLHGGCGFG
jgi:hypothetical protein